MMIEQTAISKGIQNKYKYINKYLELICTYSLLISDSIFIF